MQLDLLAATWRKHAASEKFVADLLDESVIYAVCETSARIVEQDPTVISRYMAGGPQSVPVKIDQSLAAELRALHLNLASDGDFLMISQFEDMPRKRR